MRDPRPGINVWLNGLVLTGVMLGAILLSLSATDQSRPAKLDSFLLIGGVLSIGIGIAALAGGLGRLVRRETVLMVAMVAAGALALAMVDLGSLAARGLAFSTPFLVLVLMGMWRLWRR